ncbi:LacI family DNA-binding transcriptional regulator [Parahaliea mediterranea]|uniref:LacI family DNA-binding transcriptional regulator n=1 Tax=Parahaliea mediterranea TaxID=651086 RepID=UPI0013006C5C|nr:LacI family DNA-binding transcriptional regulator [Parahaliea mediterranea]
MVSIKDVARLAGVSIATVSRALAEPDKVRPNTRDKVLAAVKQSGYVTNSLARSFRTNRNHSVVVLVPDITNSFFSNIIQGIEEVARANGYRILLGDMQNDPANARAYGDLCAQRQADGLICLGRTIPFAYNRSRKTLDPKWPPLVMACEYDDRIAIPGVRIDNERAALDGVRYLGEQGHRRIAYINGPQDSPLCRDRLKGYRKGMAELGLRKTSDLLFGGDFSLDSGAQAARALLQLKSLPTAIFAANDAMAIGALQVLKQRGVRVPDDLSLLGFDDIKFAAYCDPPLTTIAQPRRQIGALSMQIMLDILAGRDGSGGSGESRVLPHELVLRESVARV